MVLATLEFVEIAGVVKRAFEGESLGNQFLTTIRQCDAIVHVIRCFVDDNIVHVDGSVDPGCGVELINIEHALSI